MKKIIILIGIALSMLACTEQWNDMVHKEVPAYIESFMVEGQVDCNMYASDKKIEVIMPWYADPKALKVTEFKYTEGAECNPAIKVGDVIDLSEALTVTLTTYDDYVWTLIATLKPKPSGDLYNMNFDMWDTDSSPYASGANSEERNYWSSANYFLSLVGYAVVSKEADFVAGAGEGKAAMKLQTREVTEVFKTIPAQVFTGTYDMFDFDNPTILYGVPFIKHPKTLDGYACYKPQGADNGFIFVALGEWDAPYKAGVVNAFVDGIEAVPGLVGYGKKVYDKEMSAYEDFSIDITYKNDHNPTYVVVIASASNNAPVAGSTLYIDEFGFTY